MSTNALQITVMQPRMTCAIRPGNGVRLRIVRNQSDIRFSFTGASSMANCMSVLFWLQREELLTSHQRDKAVDTVKKYLRGNLEVTA